MYVHTVTPDGNMIWHQGRSGKEQSESWNKTQKEACFSNDEETKVITFYTFSFFSMWKRS